MLNFAAASRKDKKESLMMQLIVHQRVGHEAFYIRTIVYENCNDNCVILLSKYAIENLDFAQFREIV